MNCLYSERIKEISQTLKKMYGKKMINTDCLNIDCLDSERNRF